MTPSWIGWQADAALLVGLIVLAVYLWRVARVLAEMRHMQAKLSDRMDHLPSAGIMTDVRLQLGRMEAVAESTQREIHVTGARLRRVEDYLMEAKRHADDP